MAQRRPPHAKAHTLCPFGQLNWADCDVASSHQWGQCKALVDDKPEPHQCTRWATDDKGWCGQHFASETERIIKADRIAIAKADQMARMNAYFAARGQVPHTCDGIDCVFSHRSPRHVCDPECSYSPEAMAKGEERRMLIELGERMAAGGGLEPPANRVTTDRSTTELPRRKGPHRTELILARG